MKVVIFFKAAGSMVRGSAKTYFDKGSFGPVAGLVYGGFKSCGELEFEVYFP